METELRAVVVSEGVALTQSLIVALSRRFAVRVLGPVADEVQAIEALATSPVELVVVELARSDDRAGDIISAIVDGSSTPVLAVASDHNVKDPARALAAGAVGVIRGTSGSPRELASSLRRAAAGALVLPDADLPKVFERTPDRIGVGGPGHGLTPREVQVLREMASGTSCDDVAVALGISPTTVRSHVKNVMSKLGVHSTVEAVTYALRTGLTQDRRSA